MPERAARSSQAAFLPQARELLAVDELVHRDEDARRLGDDLHRALGREPLPDLHVGGEGQPLEEGDSLPEDLRLAGGDIEVGLLGGGHIHFAAAHADGADGLHDLFKVALVGGEVERLVVDRPVGD
ncbi:MAG: hypothetical protein ACLVL7_12105, partial [Anaerotruncus massiliensis (ex Togo et al. 2019)]